MTRLTLTLCLALALTVATVAQQVVFYQQLAVGQTAVALSAAGSTQCFGTLETAPVRFTLDGSTPTALIGQPLQVGDRLELGNRQDIATLKAIATTATSGALNMTCATGTTPVASRIVSQQVYSSSNPSLPVCNGLLRAAGQACR
jgi:hypothetical protein